MQALKDEQLRPEADKLPAGGASRMAGNSGFSGRAKLLLSQRQSENTARQEPRPPHLHPVRSQVSAIGRMARMTCCRTYTFVSSFPELDGSGSDCLGLRPDASPTCSISYFSLVTVI